MGIAEQHAVTFAAGMACEGLIPMCTIYSTFLQRGYDQVVHDVVLQKLPGRGGGVGLASGEGFGAGCGLPVWTLESHVGLGALVAFMRWVLLYVFCRHNARCRSCCS